MNIARVRKPTSSHRTCARVQAKGVMVRVDTATLPAASHAAFISSSDLELLRSVDAAGRIVRLGRVKSIDATSITLERGSHPMPASSDNTDTLVVDCTASGLAHYEAVLRPFAPGVIKLTSCAGLTPRLQAPYSGGWRLTCARLQR